VWLLLVVHTGKPRVKLVLWPAVSQPVCPVIRPPFETCDQFFFLFHGNSLKTFAFFFLGAPSLTRGWVCNFISHLRLGYLYVCPPGTKWLTYNPRHWVSFSSRLISRDTAEVFYPSSTTWWEVTVFCTNLIKPNP
jgi:hypothetical protein